MGELVYHASGSPRFPAPSLVPRGAAGWQGADFIQRRWTIEWGRWFLSVTAVRASYRLPGLGQTLRVERRPIGLRLLAALALALVFAVGLARLAAGSPPDRKAPPYQASMPVPPAKPLPAVAQPLVAPAAPARPVVRHRAVAQHHRVRNRVVASAAPIMGQVSADGAIAAAARTGETQAWDEPDGARGFAVAGPAETSGAQTCRAVSVLIRGRDGRSQVSSQRRCGD